MAGIVIAKNSVFLRHRAQTRQASGWAYKRDSPTLSTGIIHLFFVLRLFSRVLAEFRAHQLSAEWNLSAASSAASPKPAK